MLTPESKRYNPRGLFDNPEIMSMHQSLRKDAAESQQIQALIQWTQDAGAIMVIDSAEAYKDLDDTLERVRIAIRGGMRIIEIGGSTNENNAAEEVIPQIRRVIDEEGRNTLLFAFPRSSFNNV